MTHTLTRACVTLALVAAMVMPLFSAQEPDIYNVSIGAAGSFGINSAYDFKKSMTYSPGPVMGGGLIVEKMFTGTFGFHTGLWYDYSKFTISFPAGNTMFSNLVFSHNLSMPLQLITSFNTQSFSFAFLTGFSITHNIYSRMYPGDPAMLPTGSMSSVRVNEYLNNTQFALAGGICLKFRITKFTDFFIGGNASWALNELFSMQKNDYSCMWALKSYSGISFRTDVFPIIKE